MISAPVRLHIDGLDTMESDRITPSIEAVGAGATGTVLAAATDLVLGGGGIWWLQFASVADARPLLVAAASFQFAVVP